VLPFCKSFTEGSSEQPVSNLRQDCTRNNIKAVGASLNCRSSVPDRILKLIRNRSNKCE